MRIRDSLIPSPERIEAAKKLRPGMRVEFVGDKRDLAGRKGIILRPGYGENVYGYIPLWRVSFQGLKGEYACWHDEIVEVVG